jgi:thioredoxin reductase (NADPH)
MIVRDVIVVGAGPAGLDAALAARRAGLDYAVLEKGTLVNTVFRSPADVLGAVPSDHLEVGGLPFPTAHERPTRAEALRYYRRVADTYELDVQLEEEVTRLFEDVDGETRRVLSLETRSGRGVRRVQHARCVVLATGASEHGVRLDIPGEDLPHVSDRYSDSHGYYRKHVVIAGCGREAAEAALDLCRAGARVTLVHKGALLDDTMASWLRSSLERRIQEGAITARLGTAVLEFRPTTVVLEGRGEQDEVAADAVLVLNGRQPDAGLFDRAGIEYDPDSLAPRTRGDGFETSVPGVFVAGAVALGREAERAMREGERFRMHGDRVVRAIAARLHA